MTVLYIRILSAILLQWIVCHFPNLHLQQWMKLRSINTHFCICPYVCVLILILSILMALVPLPYSLLWQKLNNGGWFKWRRRDKFQQWQMHMATKSNVLKRIYTNTNKIMFCYRMEWILQGSAEDVFWHATRRDRAWKFGFYFCNQCMQQPNKSTSMN